MAENWIDSLEERIWELVEQVHTSGCRVSLLTTGGGSRAVSWLLNHPGASRVMLEAHIPYHPAALERLLGPDGPHKVGGETARRLALVAFDRAQSLLADVEPSAGTNASVIPLGVACTAALATDRERKGGDRAHVAIRTPQQYHLATIEFDSAAGRDRLIQEDTLSCVIVQQLVGSCCGQSAAEVGLPPWVRVEEGTLPLHSPLERFLPATPRTLELDLEGNEIEATNARSRLLLCGSFNPLHSGHRQLAAAAQRITGRLPGLELSVTNVDKAELGYREVIERVVPLRGEFPLVITRAPTFQEKARLFPGACFVIGYDTASRLLQPEYYGGSMEAMMQALVEISESGCRFLVAGRVQDGVFRTLDDLDIPQGINPDLLQGVPESAFRSDTSSTQVRNSTGADAS